LPARDRRSEPRVPTDDPAVITILLPGSHTRLEGRILNTSKNGARIELPVPVDPGVLIQMRLKDVIAMAEVRYCVPAGCGYRIGARIVSTMSSRANAPS
jgi:PilZ domain